MNKYTILSIVTAISLFVTFSLQAQLYMGVESGLNRNFLITNNAAQLSTNYTDAYGISVGVPLFFQFNKWFALEADPGYTQKNYKISRTGFYQGIYQNNKNSYIQLPVMANISVGGRRVKAFINLGLYGAYWMSSRVKGVAPNIFNLIDTAVNSTNVLNENIVYSYNEKYEFNTIKDNRLEMGWIAGTGISYTLKTNSRIFIEGRYTGSFTDQQKQYQTNQTPRYNDTYGISLGCLFRLNNKQGHSILNK